MNCLVSLHPLLLQQPAVCLLAHPPCPSPACLQGIATRGAATPFPRNTSLRAPLVPAEIQYLSQRLDKVVALFLSLTAVQFVFTERTPTSSYLLPPQQLVLATYVLLLLIR